MKNLVRIIAAVSLLVFGMSTLSVAQSDKSKSNFSIDFEGSFDLSIGDNIEINIYNGLMKQLLKDDLIESKDDFVFEFEDGAIIVDGRKLRGRNYHKYRDILEEDMGNPNQFKLEWVEGVLKKFQIRTS